MQEEHCRRTEYVRNPRWYLGVGSLQRGQNPQTRILYQRQRDSLAVAKTLFSTRRSPNKEHTLARIVPTVEFRRLVQEQSKRLFLAEVREQQENSIRTLRDGRCPMNYSANSGFPGRCLAETR